MTIIYVTIYIRMQLFSLSFSIMFSSIELTAIKQLPIWHRLEKESTHETMAMVEAHLDYVFPLLNEYRAAFRLYTLHNATHVVNILRLAGELLGSHCDKLTGLECVFIILSAAYHDLGMVFKPEELEGIEDNEDFTRVFLRQHPKAMLQFEEGNRKITKELAGWYCRWAHAKRVKIALERAQNSSLPPLRWEGIPIKRQLVFICESHNDSAEDVKANKNLNIEFVHKADLRFCALMLRISDILDFDNTRSPQSVYEYLELENPKNKSEETSRIEWEKHLVSRGFLIIHGDRGPELSFKAFPEHPFIEHAIRNFLDLIDFELAASPAVLDDCSQRWKSFNFPARIDRENIHTETYMSGKYTFSLSEEKILDVLVGDNIYDTSDQFVFIRELLQNAIDTVRHRTFVERIHNKDFKPQPIQISYFTGKDGYYWLRIDDFGMGMDEYIIRNHFLKKGFSYYHSDQFKLQKLKLKDPQYKKFTPISNFGIGLLSCFIECDTIEINTSYYNDENSFNQEKSKLRITIEGINGFSVIRSESKTHDAIPMPVEDKYDTGQREEPGYRSKTGTSIACRIKTSKESHGMNMEEILNKYLLVPEIPILFRDKPIGENYQQLIETPWCKHEFVELSPAFVNQVENFLDVKCPEGIKIELRPIDITKNAINKNLSGQMICLIPVVKIISNQRVNVEDHFQIKKYNSKMSMVCIKKTRMPSGLDEGRSQISLDISFILDKINLSQDILNRFANATYSNCAILSSHNGIDMPVTGNTISFELQAYDGFRPDYLIGNKNFYLIHAILVFKDNVLPDVNTARNRVKNLNFNIISHLMYATRELNEYMPEHRKFAYLKYNEIKKVYTISDIETSSIYTSARDYWDTLPMFNTLEGKMSTNELKQKAAGKEMTIKLPIESNLFYISIVCYILQVNFDIRYIRKGAVPLLEVKTRQTPQSLFHFAEYQFKPLQFVEAPENKSLVLANSMINKCHPFTKWFFRQYNTIDKDFNLYKSQIIYNLTSENTSYDTIQLNVEKLNGIMRRLEALLHKQDQASGIHFTMEDYEFGVV